MSGLKVTRGQRLVGKVASTAAVALLGSSAFAAPLPQPLNVAPGTHWFSDWDVKTNPAPLDFYATPNANNGNVPFVQGQLNQSALAGKPLGIQVYEGPLSSATASSLFNTHYAGDKAISYVFGDFETGSAATNVSQTMGLVNQVRSSKWSTNAYVGEFNLTPLKGYGPNVKDGFDPFGRGTPPYTESQYKQAKVNMANTALYPGSSEDRNKSTFDWANANIRTGLFVAPIGRMTAVQQKLDKDYNGHDNAGTNPLSGDGKFLKTDVKNHKQIPYVARFNNFGNSSLDTNNNPADGYRFVPGAPLPQAGLSGAQTANQMMGRGDFSAQILHYRTRGAYSVMLFEPGVQGYTKAQEQQDVRDGWYGASDPHVAHINNIFAQKDSKNATLTLNPIVDGVKLSDDGKQGFRSEQTGTIWSGEYSKNLKQLDILASNLDTINHMVKFGKIDAYDAFTLHGTGAHANDVYDNEKSDLTPTRNALIEAGFHRLLQFDLVTTRVYNNSNFTGSSHMKTIWLLNQNYQVFTNNNRNDQGIPEPTTFGMLAAAGSMAAVCRRSRKNNA
jgi:hypothetical protein